MSNFDPTEWMGTEEFCAMSGRARSTVEGERSRGTGGPPFYRFGRTVRYRRSEVEAWLQTVRRVPAATRLAEEATTA